MDKEIAAAEEASTTVLEIHSYRSELVCGSVCSSVCLFVFVCLLLFFVYCVSVRYVRFNPFFFFFVVTHNEGALSLPHTAWSHHPLSSLFIYNLRLASFV